MLLQNSTSHRQIDVQSLSAAELNLPLTVHQLSLASAICFGCPLSACLHLQVWLESGESKSQYLQDLHMLLVTGQIKHIGGIRRPAVQAAAISPQPQGLAQVLQLVAEAGPFALPSPSRIPHAMVPPASDRYSTVSL